MVASSSIAEGKIYDCRTHWRWPRGGSTEDAFGAPDVRRCSHDASYDCDGLFHYCHLCSTPLDDCFHGPE